MLKYFFVLLTLIVVGVVCIAGFRGQKFKKPPIEIFPDMDVQPKVKAQTPSTFFSDTRADRKPVPGTVPLGYAAPIVENDVVMEPGGPYEQIQFTGAPDYYNTGKIGDQWGTGMPMAITPEIMARGQQRYNISCAVCHGATGAGNGITAKYGLVGIANLNQQRIKDMADGEIYNTITHGKNTMMGYGSTIQVPDRWAIVAYIRALQRAQGASLSDVPADQRTKLEQPLAAK